MGSVPQRAATTIGAHLQDESQWANYLNLRADLREKIKQAERTGDRAKAFRFTEALCQFDKCWPGGGVV
jgi:hypothetical protein